jgi:hypothetical protein
VREKERRMEITKINKLFLSKKNDSSVATHLVWKNPSSVPTYCRLPDNQFFIINEMIAKAYFQAFSGTTREFFGEGLPSLHEIAEEFFPVFLDIDDIPTTVQRDQVKTLCTAICTMIATSALEIPEGTVVSLYTNNPEWAVHSDETAPLSKDVPDKYGVHLYFNPNEDGQRAFTVAPIMHGVACWLNSLLENKCTVHTEGTKEERSKLHKNCLLCRPHVDSGLFNKGVRPKLRMAYCDKGHPYNNRYYALFFRLIWDGQSVREFIFFLKPSLSLSSF